MRLVNPFVGLVSRVPARVQAKLLAAFLAIALLLIILGAASLYVLSGVNERTEELVKLQRKIEAYRQVQHDMTSQLYSVASALISSFSVRARPQRASIATTRIDKKAAMEGLAT